MPVQEPASPNAEHPVSGYYEDYAETQKEIFRIEVRKCRNHLFWLAGIFFAGDLISLEVQGSLDAVTLLLSSIVPLLLVGLALLSRKEPLAAVILAAVLIAGVWVFVIVMNGLSAAVAGWLLRAVVIYLVLAAFQSAREASRIKRELHL